MRKTVLQVQRGWAEAQSLYPPCFASALKVKQSFGHPVRNGRQKVFGNTGTYSTKLAGSSQPRKEGEDPLDGYPRPLNPVTIKILQVPLVFVHKSVDVGVPAHSAFGREKRLAYRGRRDNE